MEINLIRLYRKPSYTIGKLYINGKYFCDTLEDRDRFMFNSMDIEEIKRIKVSDETAIPMGTYILNLDTISNKFSKYPFYMDTCNGKLPRILNVKGFEGILIHCGATKDNTSGCVLVGENKKVGQLINSKETFTRLYAVLNESKNEEITITIQ